MKVATGLVVGTIATPASGLASGVAVSIIVTTGLIGNQLLREAFDQASHNTLTGPQNENTATKKQCP